MEEEVDYEQCSKEELIQIIRELKEILAALKKEREESKPKVAEQKVSGKRAEKSQADKQDIRVRTESATGSQTPLSECKPVGVSAAEPRSKRWKGGWDKSPKRWISPRSSLGRPSISKSSRPVRVESATACPYPSRDTSISGHSWGP